MSHWPEQIRRYRTLQQYSAERHEHAHKTNLKDGWNTSNHSLNYLPQVITFQRCILCFRIRVLNFQALAQRWENSAATCKVFPPGTDLAAPLSSLSYAKPKSMVPQNGMMESILMLWSKTSEHHLTIHKTQCTAWQYTAARGSLWSIRVVTRRIYRMNNCTQWSSLFTMVLKLKLRVWMVNTYLRCVDAQEARTGAEGIDGTTGCA